MNHDPVYNRLRELSWRRPLTESEQAELRTWLAAHPEAQTDWETEAELCALFNQLPAAPMPSNFTARVLQAVEREARTPEPERGPRWASWWRVFAPRTAVALAVVGLGLFAHYRYEATQRIEAIKKLAVVSPPSPQVLEDFDAISRLSQATPDEELLALLK